MAKLHRKLSESSPMYRAWHETPLISVFHFFVLGVVSTFLAYTLMLQMNVPDESLTASSINANSEQGVTASSGLGYASDHILVKFKSNVGQTKRNEIMASKKLKSKTKIKGVDVEVVSIDSSATAEETVQNILRDNKGDVEFAELDPILGPDLTPNDPSFSSQWNKKLPNFPIAWDRTTGSSSIVVGVADTGVDCTHPDLSANCVAGWEFYNNTSNTADDYGHGTPVAGVIAAIGNNALNVAGSVWNVKIMPLKVSIPAGLPNAGSAYASDVAEAITYAADRGVKVVNNSYRLADISQTVRNASLYLFNKGGMLVTSSGNTSANTGITFNDPTYISVGGTTSSDTKYSWSSYGTNVDIAAPGCSTATAKGGGTRSFCGTSNAAPEVSGLLALMFSLKPDLSPATMRDAVFSTAKDLGSAGWDQYFGWGRIQADKALDAIAGLAGDPPPVADTTAPSVPQGLSATAYSATQINLNWTASSDLVGVTGYNIYRNGTKIGTKASVGYVDSTVSPSTSYTYTVSAYDAAGNTSAQSAQASATTPAAPFAITSFSVSAKTSTTATIKWSTNQSATGSVSYGTTSSNLSLSVPASVSGASQTVVLPNLKRNTKYFYKINASNGTNSVSSPVSSFKTSTR